MNKENWKHLLKESISISSDFHEIADRFSAQLNFDPRIKNEYKKLMSLGLTISKLEALMEVFEVLEKEKDSQCKSNLLKFLEERCEYLMRE